MASYKITIPGQGVVTVDSPTELTDEQAYQKALAQTQAQPREVPGLGKVHIDPNMNPQERAFIEQRLGLQQEAELGRKQAKSISESPEYLAVKQQEGAEGRSQLGKMALRAAPTLALGAGGAGLAAKLGLSKGAAMLLEALTGGAGEAAGQVVAGEELDPTAMGVGAVFPGIVRGIQAGTRGLTRFVARQSPGADIVLREEAEKAVRNIPTGLLPNKSAKALFAELARDPNVKIGTANTMAAMKELGEEEAKVFPGLRSGAATRVTKGAEAIPPEIDFSTAQVNFRRLGARIQQAEKGVTQEDAGILRQIRAGMFEDMEQAGQKFEKLRIANRAFNREMTSNELGDMIASATKSEGGKDLLNVDALRNSFRKSLRTDRLFRQGLDKSEVDQIDQFFRELAAETKKSPKVGFAVLGGGIGATLGGAMGMTGVGAGLGAGLGAVLAPQAMEKIILSPTGRKLFLKIMREGGGTVSRPALALIANTVRAGQGEE